MICIGVEARSSLVVPFVQQILELVVFAKIFNYTIDDYCIYKLLFCISNHV